MQLSMSSELKKNLLNFAMFYEDYMVKNSKVRLATYQYHPWY